MSDNTRTVNVPALDLELSPDVHRVNPDDEGRNTGEHNHVIRSIIGSGDTLYLANINRGVVDTCLTARYLPTGHVRTIRLRQPNLGSSCGNFDKPGTRGSPYKLD